jgi:Zn-dependent protease
MNADALFTALMQMLILWLSVSAHEAAHAWMASRCGDPTARLLGKVSLNPLVHVDLFGTLLLPLVLVIARLPVFGWGRPAPIVAKNFRRPGWDDLWVSAAGPLVNLVAAVAGAGGLVIAVAAGGAGDQRAALLALGIEKIGATTHFPLMFTLAHVALINALLGVFNLIPVPPFDGGNILVQLLPPDWARRFTGLPRLGLMIALAFGVLGSLALLFIFWALLSYVVEVL